MPFLMMFAGPNGSGKTTLTRMMKLANVDFGTYINPDDIAVGLEGDYGSRVRQAQHIADDMREACLSGLHSFSFETVMSHPSKLEVLRRAKALGFYVQLYFVSTSDPQINIQNVSNRVRAGGHNVPEEKIIERYHRTMAMLPDAILACDKTFIFDNSLLRNANIGQMRLAATVNVQRAGLQISEFAPVPDWVRSALANLPSSII